MIEAIAKRKSIRSFADKKVEAEKVESILRAAMRAPSGINGQPWEFVVVDDREVLSAMQKLSAEVFRESGVFRGTERYHPLGEAHQNHAIPPQKLIFSSII